MSHSVWIITSYAEILDQVMREYGYSIEHMLMVDIIPDASVRKAMNEINAGNCLNLFWLILCLDTASVCNVTQVCRTSFLECVIQ